MSKEFDIVVFGATGFTGKYVVYELAKISEKEPGLKWAVAARSESKTKKILAEMSDYSGKDIRNMTIIEADIDNQQSLNDMCKRTKIVLNCVGPYSLYGEQVVKACIENGADQVDVSGEPMFLESTELNYNEAAERARVYVLGASGYESIVCEAGILFLRNKFDGDVDSVEVFSSFKVDGDGLVIHSGTWESMIGGVPELNKLEPLRKQLLKDPVPKSGHPLKQRSVLSYSKDVKRWCLLFPFTEPPIVERANYLNYHERKLRPVQIAGYFAASSLLEAIVLLIFAAMVYVMTSFSIGCNVLKKYPSFFTCGYCSKAGPSHSQMKNTSFRTTLVSRGYDRKLTNPDEQHADAPNRKMIVTVSGPEPGYVTTPICMVQAALCLLQERDKLPKNGGVMTAGAALHETSIISRLASHGLKFEAGEVTSVN